MTPEEANLVKRINERADADGLAPDHPLRIAGEKFNAAAHGYLTPIQTHNVMQFVGAWARARRAWCDYTGEPLI